MLPSPFPAAYFLLPWSTPTLTNISLLNFTLSPTTVNIFNLFVNFISATHCHQWRFVDLLWYSFGYRYIKITFTLTFTLSPTNFKFVIFFASPILVHEHIAINSSFKSPLYHAISMQLSIVWQLLKWGRLPQPEVLFLQSICFQNHVIYL